jgi:hypothetical protein
MSDQRCYTCVYKRTIPGDCHISCAKPDPMVQGHAHGVRMGWFDYPYNFDPIWIERPCSNYVEKT